MIDQDLQSRNAVEHQDCKLTAIALNRIVDHGSEQ